MPTGTVATETTLIAVFGSTRLLAIPSRSISITLTWSKATTTCQFSTAPTRARRFSATSAAHNHLHPS